MAICALALTLVFVGLRYWVLPQLDNWRPEVSNYLAKQLGQPVAIGGVEARMRGWQPELEITGLQVGEPSDVNGSWLTIAKARARVSGRSLLEGGLRLAALEVADVRVRVERDYEGNWRLAGKLLQDTASSDDRWLRNLLQQKNVEFKDVRLQLLDHTRQIADGAMLALGIEQWRIHGVGRTLRSTLQVNSLEFGPLPVLKAPLELILDAVREPRQPLDTLKTWRAEVQMSASKVDLAALRYMPWAKRLGDDPQGLASIKLSTRLEQGKWANTRVTTSATQLKVPFVAKGEIDLDFTLSTLGGTEANPITVSADKARVDLGSGLALELLPGAKLKWSDPQGVTQFAAATRTLDLAPWTRWIKTLPLPEDALGRWLRAVQLTGQLADLTLEADRSNEVAPRFSAALRFSDLVIQHDSGLALPSASGLSGQVAVTDSGGSVVLEGTKARLVLPGVLTDPQLVFDSLKTRAQWKPLAAADTKGRQWLVNVEQLEFANPDVAGSVSGTFQTHPKSPGMVDLKGQLTRGDAKSVARYLPLQMNPYTRAWIAESILGGTIDDARFELAGDLYEFPFHDDTPGRFKVQINLRDARLKYTPDFPEITDINGVLKFERDSMDLSLQSGKIFGVDLRDSRARIADFRSPLLVVEGNGNGPAQDMIRFVNQSPVGARIDDFTADTQVSGDARLQLSLSVPLANVANTAVRGVVFFIDNNIRLDKVLPPFGGVTGRLEFSDQGLRLREIAATFLGGPLKVQGQTPGPGMFELFASGTITAAGIRQQIDNPLTRELFGQTQYQARIDVKKRQARVSITSELSGLGSRLPAPFDKAPEAIWPLRVSSEPLEVGATDSSQRSAGDLIKVRIRDDIQVEVERKRDTKSERLLIKRAAFGYDLPAQLPDSGFSVAIRSPRVDLDAWTPYLVPDANKASNPSATEATNAAASSEFAPDFSLTPTQITAVADEVMVAGKKLGQVVFGATRVGGFWRANVSSRQINGFFNWREAGPGQRVGSIEARFARLEIPADEASEIESLIDQSPNTLPSINLSAETFIVGGKEMGALRLVATNAGSAARPVWRLDELVLEQPSAILRATGQWALPTGQSSRRTALSIDLELRDSGALLDGMGFPKTLKGGAGSVIGQLGWNGAPTSLDYGSLSGQFKMELGKGQFLKSDPGIAKLISVLNLQSIQRRLTLDFSDLFSEGFAFDEFKSDVQVESGIAKSAETTMRSSLAKVNINGAVDLARETQQLRVKVQPEINAGLASIGYAALVNPAIGLGTLVAQAVLRRPLQELFTNEYEVTGSWASPTVRELSRQERTKED